MTSYNVIETNIRSYNVSTISDPIHIGPIENLRDSDWLACVCSV